MQHLSYLIGATNALESSIRGLCNGGDIPDINMFSVDELPTPPNRLTNYSTFIVDAPVFLDALPYLKSAVNINSELLSTSKPNRWSMGGVVSNYTPFPTLSPYVGNPDAQVKPSVLYVSAIDGEYEYLKNYSSKVNEILNWFEGLKEERGVVSIWNLPPFTTQKIAQPPARDMGETEFNSKSTSLSQSLRDHTQSIINLKTQVDLYFNGVEKLGGVTESVTEVISCGSVTDTVLEN